jgi:hypothetical protein
MRPLTAEAKEMAPDTPCRIANPVQSTRIDEGLAMQLSFAMVIFNFCCSGFHLATNTNQKPWLVF